MGKLSFLKGAFKKVASHADEIEAVGTIAPMVAPLVTEAAPDPLKPALETATGVVAVAGTAAGVHNGIKARNQMQVYGGMTMPVPEGAVEAAQAMKGVTEITPGASTLAPITPITAAKSAEKLQEGGLVA